MRSLSLAAKFGFMALCLFAFSACGDGKPETPAVSETAAAEHDHPDEGPHGGHIIELGTEEYHAELTHDDESHRVGIYFLGDDAKTAKPIGAESVTINVSLDGESSQFILPSAPQSGETKEKSSYFELVSEPLNVVVSGKSEAARKHARLNVTFDGKPYVGLIETEEHAHDHGHAH